MASEAYHDVYTLVCWLACCLLSMTPRSLKSEGFEKIFPDDQTLTKTFNSVTWDFAPGLYEVFRADLAPTISWFKTLPLAQDGTWGVYVLVFEKFGRRPKIYIGKGTSSSKNGLAGRMAHYDKSRKTGRSSGAIAPSVQRAMTEGFTLTHKGVLVSTATPSAKNRYPLACLVMVLEAVFTLCFWAMQSREKDYCMPVLYPWPINTFTYDGLCGHFSINEGMPKKMGYEIENDTSTMTSEEVAQLALEYKQAKSRQYIANRGEGVHAANAAAARKKALDEITFYCGPCVLSFPNQQKLDDHLESSTHFHQINGTKKVYVNKKHWCGICEHSAASADRLVTHLKGPRHAKKVRLRAQLAAKAN